MKKLLLNVLELCSFSIIVWSSSKRHKNRKEENMDTNTGVYGRGAFT